MMQLSRIIGNLWDGGDYKRKMISSHASNVGSYFSVFLSQATKDLENYDAAHHEEFKRYEMMKEHERREYLKSLDEEKRREEEAHFEELKKKHKEHPKVNVPVRESLLGFRGFG